MPFSGAFGTPNPPTPRTCRTPRPPAGWSLGQLAAVAPAALTGATGFSESASVAVPGGHELAVAREPADAVQLPEELDLPHPRSAQGGRGRIGARPADLARVVADLALPVGDVGVAVPAQDV